MKKCDKEICSIDLEALKNIEDTMPIINDKDTLYGVTTMLKALSDPTRLKILYILRNCDLCVCELMQVLDKPQSTVSHHLNVLKNAGIIKPRKNGILIYYNLEKPQIGNFLDNILK